MLFKPFLEEGAQEDQGHDDHEVPAQAAAPGARAWISSAETGRCGPGELRLPLPPRLSGVFRSLSAPLTCPADGPWGVRGQGGWWCPAPPSSLLSGLPAETGAASVLGSLLQQQPCPKEALPRGGEAGLGVSQASPRPQTQRASPPGCDRPVTGTPLSALTAF